MNLLRDRLHIAYFEGQMTNQPQATYQPVGTATYHFLLFICSALILVFLRCPFAIFLMSTVMYERFQPASP